MKIITNKQKTNKTENAKTKQNEMKWSKVHMQKQNKKIMFIFANYSWTWGLSWSEVDTLSDTPPEKTNFPFPSRHQLQIAS